jgi:hypothetical protein
MSPVSASNGVDAFVRAAGEGRLTDAELAAVLTAAVKLYAARAEETCDYPPPLDKEAVNATEVATMVSEMIRVVDLNMFDLSMWHRRQAMQGSR